MNKEIIIKYLMKKTFKEKIYTVQISKSYFPKDLWYNVEIGTDIFKTWKIKAISRMDAAKKIWKKENEELLKIMIPEGNLGRHVSLYVNDPDAPGNSGLASRLTPIRVL